MTNSAQSAYKSITIACPIETRNVHNNISRPTEKQHRTQLRATGRCNSKHFQRKRALNQFQRNLQGMMNDTMNTLAFSRLHHKTVGHWYWHKCLYWLAPAFCSELHTCEKKWENDHDPGR